MNETIKIIEKNEKKNNLVYDIAILIIIFMLLFSKYIKTIYIVDDYFKFLLILLVFLRITGIFTIQRIKKLKSDRALALELRHILYYNTKGVMLTDNYIIPNLKKKNIIKYEDVVLIYKYKKYAAHGNGDQYLDIITKKGKKWTFKINTSAACIGYYVEPVDFTNIILEKNKNVLIGKTKENKEFILKRYGIRI